MPVGLLGRKIGMTQVYDHQGQVVPVTVIQAGPCAVLQVRTPERDGYSAVQLGFEDKPRRSATRAERGRVAQIGSKREQRSGSESVPKAGCEPKRFIREFRTDGEEHGCEVGAELTLQNLIGQIDARHAGQIRFTGFQIVEVEEEGQKKEVVVNPVGTGGGTIEIVDPQKKGIVYESHFVHAGARLLTEDGAKVKPGDPLYEAIARLDVIGKSKGHGMTGVMTRHNFHGQRASHGVKRVHRHPGSIGMSADPARVIKGKRMAGQYGNARVTVRHLQVVQMDSEKNLLAVKGAVPGPNGSFVIVRHTSK